MSGFKLYDDFEYAPSDNQIISHSPQSNGQPILVNALRDWLARHAEGSRLPPERQLADTFHVTRPALRKALAVLEVEGRILRHVRIPGVSGETQPRNRDPPSPQRTLLLLGNLSKRSCTGEVDSGEIPCHTTNNTIQSLDRHQRSRKQNMVRQSSRPPSTRPRPPNHLQQPTAPRRAQR